MQEVWSEASALELDQIDGRRQYLYREPLVICSAKSIPMTPYLDFTAEQILQSLQLDTVALVINGFQQTRALLGGVLGSIGDAVFDSEASRAVDGVHADTHQECVHDVSATSMTLTDSFTPVGRLAFQVWPF